MRPPYENPGSSGAGRDAGASDFVKAGERDETKNTTIPPKNKSAFARAAAAEEFGFYRFNSWRQWSRFRDRTPAEIARLRGTP